MLIEVAPQTLILILDDAQNYPAPALEEIRLLLGLGGNQRNAFALVLAGDDYLLGSLRLSVQRALFTRISATLALTPLGRDDIANYLNWQVNQAGLREIFAAASIDLLEQASDGNPRTLNMLAQAAWIAAAHRKALNIEPEDIHHALTRVPAGSAKITAA